MSQLQDNLTEILRQKDTYLLPENLKKDVTVLGITGSLEGGSGQIKLFNTVTEMNAAGGNPGDIAIVYNFTEVPIASTVTASGLALAGTIPASAITTGSKATASSGYGGISVGVSDIEVELEGGMGGNTENIYNVLSGSTDYKSLEKVVNLDSIPNYNSPGVSSYTFNIANTSDPIWNYIKFININNYSMYQYYIDSTYAGWTNVPTNLTAKAANIQSGRTALTNNGVITGTLDLNNRQRFITIPAMDEYGTTTYYKCATIKIPNGANLTLGDKRYLITDVEEPGMGTRYYGLIFNNPDTEIIMDNVTLTIKDRTNNNYYFQIDGTFNNLSGELTSSVFATGSLNGNYGTPTVSTLNNLTGITEINDTDGTKYETYIFSPRVIITNCKFTSADGTVIHAGPKASEILSTSGYYNMLGEWVQGTATVPLTQSEYNTAVTTTEEILGEEEEEVSE